MSHFLAGKRILDFYGLPNWIYIYINDNCGRRKSFEQSIFLVQGYSLMSTETLKKAVVSFFSGRTNKSVGRVNFPPPPIPPKKKTTKLWGSRKKKKEPHRVAGARSGAGCRGPDIQWKDKKKKRNRHQPTCDL